MVLVRDADRVAVSADAVMSALATDTTGLVELEVAVQVLPRSKRKPRTVPVPTAGSRPPPFNVSTKAVSDCKA